MRFERSSGVPPIRSKPCAFIFATTSGCLKIALISALSFAITGFGVPAGTMTPFHASASKPG
jgi:hypothetical protein